MVDNEIFFLKNKRKNPNCISSDRSEEHDDTGGPEAENAIKIPKDLGDPETLDDVVISNLNLSLIENNEAKCSKLIERSITQKPMLKVFCNSCNAELTSVLRIISDSNKDFCFNCLINLKVNENYHVIDNLENFHILNKNWTAKEEFQLLNCIEKFGLDNWGEITTIMKSKPKIPCEAHYYTYFLNSINSVCPLESKIILKPGESIEYDENKNELNANEEEEKRNEIIKSKGIVPDLTSNKEPKNSNDRSRSLVKNRNRKDQKNIYTAAEILGYWPKRGEFDVEYLNEAELEIAEIEFSEEDTPEDTELKLNVLHVYNMHLEEREERKK